MTSIPPSFDVALEELNVLLSDLALEAGDNGLDDKSSTLLGVQPGTFEDQAFDRLCRLIVDKVRTLEQAMSPEFVKDCMMERTGGAMYIVEIAVARGMPKPAGYYTSGDCGETVRSGDDPEAKVARVQALSFMSSELQVLSLECHQLAKRQQRRDVDEQDLEAARRALISASGECEVSDERIRALAVLFTLRRVLQVPDQNPTSFPQIERAMAEIAAKAESLRLSVPDDGNLPLLAGLELTSAQRITTNRVQAAISADFTLRRLMLLRRCDVTVRSFLRQKQGKDSEAAEMPTELKTKRDSLKDEPDRITVDDALAAPRNVAWQHLRKITESSDEAKTSTKMATIAEVPHRGGRVDAARAGPAMPAWTTRKEFDGARGRSGGRSGGRGRGGGQGGGRGRGGGQGGGRWRGGGRKGGGGRGGQGGRGNHWGSGGGGRGGGEGNEGYMGGGEHKRKWSGHGGRRQGY